MNELNLKTATFTRVNALGYEEPQKISVKWQYADFESLKATVNFCGWKDDGARAMGAKNNEYVLDIELDLTQTEIAQAISLVSQLIWDKAVTTPFISTYEMQDSKIVEVKKSLEELGYEMQDVDLTALMKKK